MTTQRILFGVWQVDRPCPVVRGARQTAWFLWLGTAHPRNPRGRSFRANRVRDL